MASARYVPISDRIPLPRPPVRKWVSNVAPPFSVSPSIVAPVGVAPIVDAPVVPLSASPSAYYCIVQFYNLKFRGTGLDSYSF